MSRICGLSRDRRPLRLIAEVRLGGGGGKALTPERLVAGIRVGMTLEPLHARFEVADPQQQPADQCSGYEGENDGDVLPSTASRGRRATPRRPAPASLPGKR